MADRIAAKSLQAALITAGYPAAKSAAQRSPAPKGKGDRCKGLGAPCATLHPSADPTAADRCTSLQSLHIDDEEERDAIQNEARYAVRQSIPEERMVRGLIEASR